MSSVADEQLSSDLVSDEAVARFRDSVSRVRACRDLAPYLYGDAIDAATGNPACFAMAQTVGTLMARLDELADPRVEVSQTPREALLALVDVVRHALCLSLQHYLDIPAGQPREAMTSAFNSYAAVRQVPIEAIVEGLHSVGYVSAKLRIERATLRIRRRVEAELYARGCLGADGSILDAPTKDADGEGSIAADASTAALHVTHTLVDDFQQLYENTLRLLDAEGQTGEPLLGAALREYYKLTDWVLLAESATQVPAISFTTIHNVVVDLTSGEATFTVRRTTNDTPWGLLFNDKACLIDVDVAMRGRKGARDLHHLLRCATEGARVVAINDQSLPDSADSDVQDAPSDEAPSATAIHRHRVLMALRDASKGTRKRMQVTIQSPQFKQDQIMDSHVAAFAIPFQGSEWAAGQCAMLVMQRLRPNATLPVAIDASLRVMVLAPLGGVAGTFLEQVGERVRVLAVNGVEVFAAEQAEALMRDADTVMLTLVMIPPALPGQSVPEARRRPSTRLLQPLATIREAVAAAPPAPEPVMEEEIAAVEGAYEPLPEYADAAIEESTEPLDVGDDAEKRLTDAGETRVEEDREGVEDDYDANLFAAVEAEAAEHLVTLTTPAEQMGAAMAKPQLKRGRKPKAIALRATADVTESSLVESILRELSLENELGDAAVPTKKTAKPKKVTHRQAKGLAAEEDHEGEEAVEAMDEATLLENIAAEVAAEDGGASPRGVAQGKRGRKPKALTQHTASSSCVFANGVKLVELSDKVMVLERPSTKQPWGIEGEMASHATDFPGATGFRITRLPAKPLVADHPYLHKFDAAPPTWYVAGVNSASARGKTGQFVVDKMRQLKRMTLHILHK